MEASELVSENSVNDPVNEISTTTITATETHDINPNFSYEGLSEKDCQIVLEVTANRLLYFAECGFATFIPLLGIIFPEDSNRNQTHSYDNWFVINSETIRTLNFEKTDELLTSHRLQFPRLLELRELTDAVFEKLQKSPNNPIQDQKLLRRFLRKYFRHLRNNLIKTGKDFSLAGLGKFFALHNRQGNTESQWYAGSDISISSKWTKILNTSSSSKFERPVLQSAFEVTDFLFQDEVKTYTVQTSKIVESLGFDIPHSYKILPKEIKIKSYHHRISDFRREAVFASDGIRKTSVMNDKKVGNEFIIRIPIHSLLINNKDNSDSIKLANELCSDAPEWIFKAFICGMLLSYLSKDGCAVDGSALPLENSLQSTPHASFLTPFSVIASFSYTKVGQIQLTQDCPFYFASLVSLDEQEAGLITNGKKEVLRHFLKRKGYDQVLSPSRPSILNKTFIS